MKKKAIIGVVLSVLTLAIAIPAINYYLTPTESIRSLYLIPKDAVYFVEIDESVEAWETLSSHPMWSHLRTNDYFAELTASANGLDSLVKNNSILKSFVGKRTILTSAHMHKRNDYEFLFVVDLQRQSKLPIETLLESMPLDGYKINTRQYKGFKISELYDQVTRETLYLAIIKNNLVGSYIPTLLEASIDQLETPYIGRDIHFLEIEQAITYDGLCRVYFQYNYLDEYMRCYMDEDNAYVKSISELLYYTGADVDLDGNIIRMKGYTNINDSTATYLSAMLQSGTGSLEIAKLAPQRTAFYLGMGFDSFLDFFEKFESLMKNDMDDYEEYHENLRKVEKFLGINLKEHFMSWIDDELAFIQTQPGKLGKSNEFAVVLKAKDGEEAKEKLDFLTEQIKKKTPVKFKEVTYKGYPIGFLSVKGFFRMMLGKFFADLEKPYFTVIDDFVVFSNHPQTIKSIIDDWSNEKTLANLEDFQTLSKEFDSNSNVFIYMQTGVLQDNLKEFVDNATWREIEQNRQYTTCFSHIGFQLVGDGGAMMATNMAAIYQDPNQVEKEMREMAFEQRKAQNTTLDGEVVMKSSTGEDSVITDMSTEDLVEAVEEEEMMAIDEISPDDLDAKQYEEKHENGQVKFVVSLKDGLKHGSYIEYHPNGEIKYKGRFKDDKRDGIWKEYDESGKRINRVRYRDGEIVN